MEAISNAGSCVGILAKDGVVLAAEKRITSKVRQEPRVPGKRSCLCCRASCCPDLKHGSQKQPHGLADLLYKCLLRACSYRRVMPACHAHGPAQASLRTHPRCSPLPACSCWTARRWACGARRCTASTTTLPAR